MADGPVPFPWPPAVAPSVPLRPVPWHGPLAAAETKRTAAPVAAAEGGVFEGYASLFGVVDLGRDMVMPGAFAASLAARGAAGIRLLWQHDPEQPVGRWQTVEEDAKGLFVRGVLNLRVARARELHALMLQGAIDGLSIGYRTVNARTEPRSGIRKLFRLDLWEVSLVTFPLLPAARVAAVKAAPGPHPPRPARRRLRTVFVNHGIPT